MKRSANSNPSSGTPGGSALMVVFAVLCLTVFAILVLSTVLSDAKRSDSYAEGVSAYYAAEAEAEETIATLRAGVWVPGVSYQDGIYSFSCEISDTKALAVRVRIGDGSWEVLSKNVVYTAGWQAEGGVTVWDGQ